MPETISSNLCIVTLTFDLKIYRAHPCLVGSLHVKFHDDRCKGKAVIIHVKFENLKRGRSPSLTVEKEGDCARTIFRDTFCEL